MEAKVIQRFYGVDDGKIYPRWIEVGEELAGSIAEAAVASGDAVAKKKRRAPKPENLKTSSASQPAPASQKTTVKKRRGRPPKSSS